MRRALLPLALLLCWLTMGEAATYYTAVSGGNDSNPGTEQSPKRTVNAGIRLLHAGDTLYLRGGTYTESIDSNDYGSAGFPVGSGWGQPVTIASAPGETATLQGTVNLPHGYLQYIVLSRLRVDLTGRGEGMSLGADGGHHLRFAEGEFFGARRSNVYVYGHHNEIVGNDIHHSLESYGIYFSGGADSLIQGNDIHHNGGYGLQIYGESTTADRHTVRNNRIHHNGFHSVGPQGGSTSAMVVGRGQGHLVYNNLVYSNNQGIEVYSGCQDCQIYNNTLWDNGSGINVRNATVTGTIIRNNILWQSGGITGSGVQTQQSHNLMQDPRFVNAEGGDFRVHPGSPAIGAAMNLAAIFRMDMVPVLRPSQGAWTAGAYEAQGATPPPTTTGVVYHIAPSGNDSRSCDDARSPDKAKHTFASGLRCLHAGETLYAHAGTYSETIDSNAFSGTSFPAGTSWSAAVTIASAPGETATLRGPGGSALVNLPHGYIQYVVFDRLVLDATGYKDGISFGSSGAHHLRVSNGEVKNAQGQGLILEGTGNEILHNQIHHNGTDTALDHGIYWTGNDGLIDGNTFAHNAAYGLQLYDGSFGDVDRNIIRNNRMTQNRGQGGITLSKGKDNQCYNNVVDGNGVLGIQISSGTSNQQVYNNTIVNNSGPGILVKENQGAPVLRNNILWGNSGTPIENRNAGTVQSHNVTTDPRFVNPGAGDFRVQQGSPALNAAMNMSAMFRTDMLGLPRPPTGMWTVGAYQSGSAVLPVLQPPTNLRWSSAPSR